MKNTGAGLTLDAALDMVADRSFYEDCTVTPSGGVYTVEDDYIGDNDEDVPWTYDDGAEWAGVSDHSRVHEAYEYYANAAHIRYNMGRAVRALESGTPVTFGYRRVVDAALTYDDETGAYIDDDGEHYEDNYVGWALVAIW